MLLVRPENMSRDKLHFKLYTNNTIAAFFNDQYCSVKTNVPLTGKQIRQFRKSSKRVLAG